jgi:hypothetical protein
LTKPLEEWWKCEEDSLFNRIRLRKIVKAKIR